MSKKSFSIDEIGEVLMHKSLRAKHINIALKPNRPIQVTVPHRVSYEDALKIVYKKIDWIKKNLPKVEKIAQQKTVFREDSIIQTKNYQFSLQKHAKTTFQIKWQGGKAIFYYPITTDIQTPEVQSLIAKALEATWQREAKEFLPKRTTELAQIHKFSFQKVKITSAKTRWGSCSGKNVICLSLHLMRLPDELLDYVILHELCHTIEKNHKQGFWSLLDKVCAGKAKILDKSLNNFRIEVY
jgi:predicted metal-dependent hydrolase